MLPILAGDADMARPLDTTPFFQWLTRQVITGVLHTKLITALRDYKDIPTGRSDIDGPQMFLYRGIHLAFLAKHRTSNDKTLHECIDSYDATMAYMVTHSGNVSIVYSMFTRPEILNVAYHLNLWNAKQPMSNAEHTAHYKLYVQPINDWLATH